MSLNIQLETIQDLLDVRNALQKIKEGFDKFVFEKGDWKFFEITLNSAVTELRFSHKLNFTPKDVIQLSVTDSATITWHYDDFDSTYIVLSSSTACTVRAFIGRVREIQ
jgi:hypothetical protein